MHASSASCLPATALERRKPHSSPPPPASTILVHTMSPDSRTAAHKPREPWNWRSVDPFVGRDDSELPRTDRALWRLTSSEGSHGRHLWHFLTPEQSATWPQTDEDKYWLGLPLAPADPPLPPATTPAQAASNGFTFYKRLQAPDGHWSGEYGGPLFLLPGLVIANYVSRVPMSTAWRTEFVRYLANMQNEDGGWGLHIEDQSTVFGTALNYVVLRLLGLPPDHPVAQKARTRLHTLGGATGAPSWGKMWLAILGVYDWDGMAPIPPELWVLPDFLPVHPHRWWIHTRQVYLPMGYIWAERITAPDDALLTSLREELYVQPYESIDWPKMRTHVSEADVYSPHSYFLDGLFALMGVYEQCRIEPLRQAGIRRAYELVVMEDENTKYQCLGPVNKMLNQLVRWHVDGPGSEAFALHVEKTRDFVWMSDRGLMMTGTNGSQLWDASFIAQAMADAGLSTLPEHNEACQRLLDWLDKCQIRENPKFYKKGYRHATKGAWPFSTPEQGYTVSDTTAEGMTAVLRLQDPTLKLQPRVSVERLHDTVDLLLSLQNPGGGFASYELVRGSTLLEALNPAEVFANIMVEYPYVECSTSVVAGLLSYEREIKDGYRHQDIQRTVQQTVKWILTQQREDGSWYGSWAICMTYAAMFSLHSLRLAGYRWDNTPEVRRGVEFLLSKQNADGGWGETYESCTTGVYTQAAESQVVQTSWAVIALMHADYHTHDSEPILRAAKLIMSRQTKDGAWKQERIEGVFNKNCTCSHLPGRCW